MYSHAYSLVARLAFSAQQPCLGSLRGHDYHGDDDDDAMMVMVKKKMMMAR